MKNLLVLIALSLFSLSAFASSMTFKVCSPKNSDVTIAVSDAQVVIQSADLDGDIILANKGEETFQPGVFGENEDLVLMLADIESFNDGLFVTGGSDNEDIPVFIFNYGVNQKSVLLLVGGLPLYLGKTEECQK